MTQVQIEDLLLAGSHFGHLTRRWDPKMRKYIFMERNGIHIIDLKKTLSLLEEAANALSKISAEVQKSKLSRSSKTKLKEAVRFMSAKDGSAEC